MSISLAFAARIAILGALVFGRASPAYCASVNAVTTPGAGDFTICRSWLVYDSCNTYHKVELPARVSIGDDIDVTFGSNHKVYTFHVVRILRQSKKCRILSNVSDPQGGGERIEVPNCHLVEKPAAEATPPAEAK